MKKILMEWRASCWYGLWMPQQVPDELVLSLTCADSAMQRTACLWSSGISVHVVQLDARLPFDQPIGHLCV